MVEALNWLSANWVELFGVLTGAGAVFFLARDKGVVGWILGIINSVFFLVLFFGANLYADVTLNGYYFITCLLGLFWWLRGGKNNKPLPISHLDLPGWVKWGGIWIVGTLVMGFVLDTYTAADIAYLDSFTTVGSLIGQYLLARKVFDNWYIWIFVDVLDIFIYGYKGLYMVVGLTVLYMALCVMGLHHWKKVERGEAEDETTAARSAELAAA